jgi:aminopeptidase N
MLGIASRILSASLVASGLAFAALGNGACNAAEDSESSDSGVEDADLTRLSFRGQRVATIDATLPDFDVIGYEFDLDLVPSGSARNVAGSVVATFVTTGPVSEARFDFTGPKENIKSAFLGRTKLALRFAEGSVFAKLPSPVLRNKVLRIKFDFVATPTANAAQGSPFGLVSNRETSLFSANWPNRARSWIPSRDNPRDAAMFSLTARANAGDTVLSNGVRTSKPLSDGRTEFASELLQPMPLYGFFLGVDTDWQASKEQTPKIAVEQYLQTANKQSKIVEDADLALAYFERTFGRYAWSSLRFVDVPTTWGSGGMEHVGVISLDPSCFRGDKREGRLVVVHELAHHWSGNLVRIGTWNDYWMSEGFTEYLTRRFIEENDGAEAGKALWDETIANARAAANAGLMRPSGDLERTGSPKPILDAIFESGLPYVKGAWILRVLEKRVGREAFTAFLKEWFRVHAFQTVSSEQFRDELEAATAKDFHPFFNDVVFGRQNPE